MNNPLILKLSVASRLDAADEAVLRDLTARSFEVGRKTDLIDEGDSPQDVHLVLKGVACRYKIVAGGRRQILALLLPGDFCDLHVALLREMDHSIATISGCTVVRISRQTVEELIRHHPRITRALWWATLVDEAVMRENIAGLGQRETDRQMAHLFCELFMRFETVGMVRDGAFELPLTQEELGDMLGVSVVHANRTLMELRARRLLSFEKGRATILDFERLTAFAGFRSNYLHLSGIDEGAGARRGGPPEIFVGSTRQSPRPRSPVGAPTLVPVPNGAQAGNMPAMFTTKQIELSDRRVLVVEDEYFVAQELTAAVRNAGGRVVGPVANLEDALALIGRTDAVDAAILDINLGGAKVFPVAAALQKLDIPIVFVTGYDDWVIPQDYDDVPVFRKPADADNVVRLLFQH